MFEQSVITSSYIKENCRKYVYVRLASGQRLHMAFSRYLMSCKLNRVLETREHVHHIDGDCMNDSIDNLEIVDSHDHNAIHKTAKPETHVCFWCKEEFELVGKRLYLFKWNKKYRDQQHVFCCSVHARKYAANKRWGNI